MEKVKDRNKRFSSGLSVKQRKIYIWRGMQNVCWSKCKVRNSMYKFYLYGFLLFSGSGGSRMVLYHGVQSVRIDSSLNKMKIDYRELDTRL